jgi:hypothetical protein
VRQVAMLQPIQIFGFESYLRQEVQAVVTFLAPSANMQLCHSLQRCYIAGCV